MAVGSALILTAALCALCTMLQARPDVDKTSPQFLYMEHLHGLLKDSDQPLADLKAGQSSDKSGNLIATSIEASSLTGGGLGTNDSFTIVKSSTMEFQMTVPNKKDSGYVIHSAELWFFPDEYIPLATAGSGDSVLELTVIVKATLPHANRPRTATPVYIWRPQTESCIRLNVTKLSRSIANNLQKKNLKEVNITISAHIVAIRELSESRVQETTDLELSDMCTTLANRTRNTPFLAIKYFDKNPALFSLPSSAEGESHQQKRQTDNVSVNRLDVSQPVDPGCQRSPLHVDFSEIYGDFIIYPEAVDIGDCAGSCSAGYDFNLFSMHAITKERLRLSDEEKSIGKTSCVPVAYTPLSVLIAQDSYLVIVEFEDMVVKGCGCR